jgi:Trk-type K+ transport system membrane component
MLMDVIRVRCQHQVQRQIVRPWLVWQGMVVVVVVVVVVLLMKVIGQCRLVGSKW